GAIEPIQRPAAAAAPSISSILPYPGENHVRPRRAPCQVRRAAGRPHVKGPAPCLAAVSCSKYASLFVVRERVAQRRNQGDSRIARIDENARYLRGFVETSMLPRLAAVARDVDPVSERHVVPGICLARADPHDIRMVRCNRNGADGPNRLTGPNVIPV